jgi:uncharacterized protein (DUF1800 family)
MNAGVFRLCVRVVVAAAVFAAALSVPAAAGRFDEKLAKDKEAAHVLSRLTFGPRADDLEDVRRLGVEAWVRRQLDPPRIPQNPTLDARLQPLTTLQLASWQINEGYRMPAIGPGVPPPKAPKGTPSDLLMKLVDAPLAERRAILDGLVPDVRRYALAVFSGSLFEGLPDIQAEAAKARTQLNVNPLLNDLLTTAQLTSLMSGSEDDKVAVLSSIDPEKRRKILGMLTLPPDSLPGLFRREMLASRMPQEVVSGDLIANKLYRALYSPRQLEEVLADFWLNHFNVFIGKGQVRLLLTSYERDAIRPHVLGRFRDLLLATARHPAMLFYLDNWLSQDPRDGAPQPAAAQPVRRLGLNENYGRELLELHTLGVDGGYTQADVIAVARCFTGWTIFEPNGFAEFQFNPAMHDRGEKVVLGRTIPRGGGESDGVTVIDLLARHPSTARFISRKLAQRFVVDDPPRSLVDRMAETFRRTDGDLRAVMETLLFSREFLSEGAWQSKLKSPLEMVVSSLRALNADVADTAAIAQRIAELGQPLYGKVEPTGYPDTGEMWASSAGLLGRTQFTAAVAAGQISGVKVDLPTLPRSDRLHAAARLLGIAPSRETMAALEKGLGATEPSAQTLVAVLLASPDFQKR